MMLNISTVVTNIVDIQYYTYTTKPESTVINGSLCTSSTFHLRAMIFEQPFGTTFMIIFFFSLFIGQKQWRDKKDERE